MFEKTKSWSPRSNVSLGDLSICLTFLCVLMVCSLFFGKDVALDALSNRGDESNLAPGVSGKRPLPTGGIIELDLETTISISLGEWLHGKAAPRSRILYLDQPEPACEEGAVLEWPQTRPQSANHHPALSLWFRHRI